MIVICSTKLYFMIYWYFNKVFFSSNELFIC